MLVVDWTNIQDDHKSGVLIKIYWTWLNIRLYISNLMPQSVDTQYHMRCGITNPMRLYIPSLVTTSLVKQIDLTGYPQPIELAIFELSVTAHLHFSSFHSVSVFNH